MTLIRRYFHHAQATIVASTCESTPVDMREYRTLQLHAPAALTAAEFGLKVSQQSNTLFKPLYAMQFHSLGLATYPAVLHSMGPNQVHQFPAGVEGSGFVKIWSMNTTAGRAGQDINQAAVVIFGVSLKG